MRYFGEYFSSYFYNWFGLSGPIFPAWINVQHGGIGGNKPLEKRKKELVRRKIRVERKIAKVTPYDPEPLLNQLKEEIARIEWELEEIKRVMAERKKRRRAEDELLLLLTY